ncbi:hypothetical protein B0H13DRAFT_2344966 [Mycena leptocephala]|nr:hypothetical protein B0H13DRAFT_2344966 [Mycena leptocephala]
MSAKLLESINHGMLGVSIPGVVLSVLLLAATAYLQWKPVSRPHLDRVSFRLLVYALVANVIFGSIIFLDVTVTSSVCSLTAFLGVTSSMFSACMFCCVALNLQLVLVYGVNGNTMEKFYIFGAVFLCGACTIPTLAAGEFGWYATNGTCWFRDPTPTAQLHWLLGTYSVPMLSMSTVEMKIQRLRADTMSQHSNVSESGIATLASSLPKHPIVRFRWMIVRIALYPLLSCFLSTTACIFDVYSVMHPNLTDFNMNLRTTNLCIYASRPLLYALLAGTDPSFIRAVRSLCQKSCSLCTQPPWSPNQTATTDSYGPALTELAKKCNGTSGVSSAGNTERRPSRAEAALAEEELQSERIAHQI